MARRRRRRRRWNYRRVAAVVAIAVVAVLGVRFLVNGTTTDFTSVSDDMGEIVVRANEKVLDKDTGKTLKKNLYVPRKIDTTKKVIAFSFDDGPKPGNTERVIKALDKADYRATFFMLGQSAKAYPDSVKAVAKSGNEVGGHSWNHKQLTTLSASAIAADYKQMNDAVVAACGSGVTAFRPPYGAINDTVKANIPNALILWDVDTLDWKTRNVDKTVESILKNAHDGSIILMHDIHEPTVQAVEKVIPMLKRKGYEVVTVSELMELKGIQLKGGQTVISADQIR